MQTLGIFPPFVTSLRNYITLEPQTQRYPHTPSLRTKFQKRLYFSQKVFSTASCISNLRITFLISAKPSSSCHCLANTPQIPVGPMSDEVAPDGLVPIQSRQSHGESETIGMQHCIKIVDVSDGCTDYCQQPTTHSCQPSPQVATCDHPSC